MGYYVTVKGDPTPRYYDLVEQMDNRLLAETWIGSVHEIPLDDVEAITRDAPNNVRQWFWDVLIFVSVVVVMWFVITNFPWWMK